MSQDFDTAKAVSAGRCAVATRMSSGTPRRIAGARTKTDDWLSFRELTLRFEVSHGKKALSDAWDGLVASASLGLPPSIGGNHVRMAACRIKGVDRWCILAEDAALLVPACRQGYARHEARPAGWLSRAEALSAAGSGVEAEAFHRVWREMQSETRSGRPANVQGLPVRVRSTEFYGEERWFLNAEDVGILRDAARYGLSAMPDGFSTPSQLLRVLHPEYRRHASRLLQRIEATYGRSGGVILEGHKLGMTRCLVAGKPCLCIAAGSIAVFMEAVRELHDRALARAEGSPAM